VTLDAVIVNALYPSRFTDAERIRLQRARSKPQSPTVSAALGAALSEHARARTQAEQLERLHGGLGHELIGLPYLFAEQIAQPELEALADALDEGLQALESSLVSR
jgi:hypothetical protein